MNTEYNKTTLEFRNGLVEQATLNTAELRVRRTIASVNLFGLSETEYYHYGKLFAAAPELLEDNKEWVLLHRELMQEGLNISKDLSDRLFSQVAKSNRSIKKATE